MSQKKEPTRKVVLGTQLRVLDDKTGNRHNIPAGTEYAVPVRLLNKIPALDAEAVKAGATYHEHGSQPQVGQIDGRAPEDRPMKQVTKGELVERAVEVEVEIDGEVATEDQLDSRDVTKKDLVALIKEATSTSPE